MNDVGADNAAKAANKIDVQNRVALIEFCRGIAAFAVVLVHSASVMREPQYSGHVGVNGIFRLGFLGVDFFFVLSGFIIYYVHAGDLGRPERALRYAWRRVTRIFPTYWSVLALTLVINVLIQRDKAPISPGWLIGQFTLSDNPWLGPAWTLRHELTFYLLFGMLLLNRRVGLLLLGLWFISIYAFYLVTGDYLREVGPFMPLLLHPYNLMFLLGMSVGIVARANQRYMVGLAAFYTVAFGLGSFFFDLSNFDWHQFYRYPWIGTGFAALLAWVVWASQYVRKLPRGLTYIGTISYSLYLIHVIPIGYTYAILARIGLYPKLPESVCLVLAVLAAIVSAACCYEFLEKHVLAWARRKMPAPARKSASSNNLTGEASVHVAN